MRLEISSPNEAIRFLESCDNGFSPKLTLLAYREEA